MSQKVLVAGTGKSGIAAAKLLLAMGGEVVLYDGNDKLDPEKIKENFEEDAKVTIVLGELTRPDLLGVELSIISPGIPLDAPFVPVLDEAKIPIWSEIQLAYHVAKGKLIAITGTNGKTTTTALTGAIMKTFFDEVFVVGNIGIPYTDVALDTTDKSVTVAEVSSFQLETIMDFHPNVSAILNITPDHLNRHGTMENYIEVKERVAVNQTEDDCIVLNYDDKVLREFGEKKDLKPKVIFFSSTQTLKEGMYLDGDMMIYAHDGKKEEVLNVKTDMQLLGKHNYENVMAAVAMSIRMGVPMESIRKAVKEFKAVEHRIEFVLERSGVRYYNDSKGTNPDAAIQAIRAMPGPTVLIAGGYDKHSEYDEWIEEFGDKVKYLVLIGQTRDKIAECARAHGFTDIMYAEDMAEAVRVCAAYANAGDNVLLSPACASWGMFDNYEQRGEIFKECVRNL
ncbi:UDP-N-acetylmuramoyl-L-alanine--D-glutamate ligase [Ventrimonas sp. CLA-AP-H27]|uniref:UDP-N-acetylmuramoylalanine--D-glutamate ligase n=1 Tax=Ventrimonas faecis TaxID=3133170 RepID=A0ABV1HM81_9FIRM